MDSESGRPPVGELGDSLEATTVSNPKVENPKSKLAGWLRNTRSSLRNPKDVMRSFLNRNKSIENNKSTPAESVQVDKRAISEVEQWKKDTQILSTGELDPMMGREPGQVDAFINQFASDVPSIDGIAIPETSAYPKENIRASIESLGSEYGKALAMVRRLESNNQNNNPGYHYNLYRMKNTAEAILAFGAADYLKVIQENALDSHERNPLLIPSFNTEINSEQYKNGFMTLLKQRLTEGAAFAFINAAENQHLLAANSSSEDVQRIVGMKNQFQSSSVHRFTLIDPAFNQALDKLSSPLVRLDVQSKLLDKHRDVISR